MAASATHFDATTGAAEAALGTVGATVSLIVTTTVITTTLLTGGAARRGLR